MTGTGEDPAREMLQSAQNIFDANRAGITPAAQALFNACAAQAQAAIDIREMITGLTGGGLEALVQELEGFTAAAGALTEQLKRFNDGHDF